MAKTNRPELLGKMRGYARKAFDLWMNVARQLTVLRELSLGGKCSVPTPGGSQEMEEALERMKRTALDHRSS